MIKERGGVLFEKMFVFFAENKKQARFVMVVLPALGGCLAMIILPVCLFD